MGAATRCALHARDGGSHALGSDDSCTTRTHSYMGRFELPTGVWAARGCRSSRCCRIPRHHAFAQQAELRSSRRLSALAKFRRGGAAPARWRWPTTIQGTVIRQVPLAVTARVVELCEVHVAMH